MSQYNTSALAISNFPFQRPDWMDLIDYICAIKTPFGIDYDHRDGFKRIPNTLGLSFAVYILRFDRGYYKIGRISSSMEQRLYGYLRDIRLGKSLYNSRNFVLEYMIAPHRLQNCNLENALMQLHRPYRIKGEYFRRLDKRFDYILRDLAEEVAP